MLRTTTLPPVISPASPTPLQVVHSRGGFVDAVGSTHSPDAHRGLNVSFPSPLASGRQLLPPSERVVFIDPGNSRQSISLSDGRNGLMTTFHIDRADDFFAVLVSREDGSENVELRFGRSPLRSKQYYSLGDSGSEILAEKIIAQGKDFKRLLFANNTINIQLLLLPAVVAQTKTSEFLRRYLVMDSPHPPISMMRLWCEYLALTIRSSLYRLDHPPKPKNPKRRISVRSSPSSPSVDVDSVETDSPFVT